MKYARRISLLLGVIVLYGLALSYIGDIYRELIGDIPKAYEIASFVVIVLLTFGFNVWRSENGR